MAYIPGPVSKYLCILTLLAAACTGDDPVFTDAAPPTDVAPVDSSASADADVTAPVTTITDAPADPSNDADPSFSFEADEPATFECRVDDAAFAACASPFTQTVPDGAHVFEVRATDGDNNREDPPAQHAWTVDTDPPDTTITAAPAALDNSVDVSFEFTSDEDGTFECRLDGAAFAACTSPQPYTGLADGEHTFDVRAIDLAGNVDASPATHPWTLDSTTPDTQIDTGPSGTTTSTTGTFTFSSPDAGAGATFECRLGGGSFTTCTSPKSYPGLGDATYTFDVRVRDAGGNVDPSPASRTWTVDLNDPDTFIDSGPTGTVASNAPTFTFHSNEATATFECQLDAAAYAACTTPKSYTGVADGGHTFRVRAIDVVGHVDATPATQTWTIDSVLGAPTITAITTTTADGRYGAGSTVTIVITFSEVVYVTGSPTLLLETGATDRSATLTGGTGTTTLTFTYVVQTGDTTGDLDYASTGALTGGAIADGAGNAAVRTLPTPGATGSIAPTHAVVIAAAPPVMTSVTVTPTTAYTDTTMTCTPAATDADGDAVTFTYGWTVNAVTVAGATSSTLAGTSFSKGQAVRCVATPSDGGQSGTAMTSSPVTILNTAPVMSTVAITPSNPTTTSTLTCTPTSSDADADGVTYGYEWRKGGVPIAGQTASTLAGSQFDRADVITCRVTPSDGTATGTAMTSGGVTILNSAPTASAVTVTASPSPARTSSVLTCSATTADADADAVTLTYAWLKNGSAIAGQTATALDGATQFAYNDQIVCQVTPNDGTVNGSAASSTTVTIGNTAPVMSSVSISPTTAYTTDTLTCSPSATDADGHSVTYGYEWIRSGIVIGTAQTLAGSAFSRGETITCRVTPTDSINTGSSMTSSGVTISNTAPVMATVTISPSTAYTNDTLTCTPTASDADSDAISYSYQWWRVGSPATLLAATQTLGGASFNKNEQLYCIATPSDGTATGSPMTSATIVISNSAPTAPPAVSLTPANPSPFDTLTCSYTASSDPDGDSIGYEISWGRNGGLIVGATGTTLAPSNFTSGDKITCAVIATDGLASSAASYSNSVTIAAAPQCVPARELSCPNMVTAEWTTTGSGSTDQIDQYSCTSWDERGREYAYFVKAQVSGPMSFTVNPSNGVDLDVFVIAETGQGCASNGCTASGDQTATWNAVAGTTYYLIVDGYQGAEGSFWVQMTCPG